MWVPTRLPMAPALAHFVNSTWDKLKEEESSYFNIREAYEVRNNIFDPRNWSKIK